MPLAPSLWLKRTYSLRTLLIAFGLATFLPVTILTGLLLERAASLERAQLESRARQVAKDLAQDVDRAIGHHFTVAKTLAALPSLTTGDWPTFYNQAKAVLQDKAYAIVIDNSLRQLVNTRVPYDKAPRVTGDPETAQQMLITKQPAVSNLFFSLIDKTPSFNVNIPMLENGEVRYILIFGQNAADLLPLLAGQQLPSEWTTAILDRKGLVLSRSKEHARFVGTVQPAFAADLAIQYQSLRRATSIEGSAVLRAAARSELTGWLIVASIPLGIAEAPLRYSAWLWGLAAAVALTITAILVWLLARTLTSPMIFAAKAARALGRNEPIPSLHSRVTEANAIVAALQQARSELTERDNHQRLLLKELSHRVKNMLAVVQALVTRTLPDDRPMSEAREVLIQRLHALGRAQDLLMRTDWRGTPLKDIIETEMAAISERVEIDGPELIVSGNMVQTMALVLHELATNAAKYGALSNAKGKVSIKWSITGSGPDAWLKFRWKEKHGPAVSRPIREGFGSTLLKAALPSDGKTRIFFEPDGLLYELNACVKAIAQRP